jgi:hypothetical protein
MRKALILLLLYLPATLLAQLPVAVSPQQCVWRAGDDPAWSAPALDDSAWHPYLGWALDPHTPRLWVRCHANLAPISAINDPALQ